MTPYMKLEHSEDDVNVHNQHATFNCITFQQTCEFLPTGLPIYVELQVEYTN